MSKLISIILIMWIFQNSIFPQSENYQASTTSVPDNSRYEIIQSEMIAKLTFKIDRYEGSVFQLVLTSDSTLTWQKIKREKSLNDKIEKNRVNYQLFISGLAVKYTFLVNLNTGVTWQLVKNKDDDFYWELLQE
jgi:hypothetical protein